MNEIPRAINRGTSGGRVRKKSTDFSISISSTSAVSSSSLGTS
jgi:hypothetical protein